MNLLLLASSLLVLHMDFNSTQMRKDAVVAHLHEAASAGYNAILWEVEDKVRWETCPECVHPDAFTKREFREILDEAARLGLEPIPLLQTFAHAEYVLDRKPCPNWRELPDNPTLYCVSQPEVRDFLSRFIREYLDLFGDRVRYFHLGGDEAHDFGKCAVCSKRDKIGLYVEHLSAMASVLAERKVRPCIWCDMMLTGDLKPDELRRQIAKFPKSVVPWYWDYYFGWAGQNVTIWANRLDYLSEAGFETVMAPAAASCGDSPFLPYYRRHAANVAACADWARSRKMLGLCVTSWSVHLSPKRLQYPLWELAARRFLSPGASMESDFDAVLKRRLGKVDAQTLYDLTDWHDGLSQFDSRFGIYLAKWAKPKPTGAARQAIAEERKRTAPRFPKAEDVRRMQAGVSRALAKVEADGLSDDMKLFAEGARLAIASADTVVALEEGKPASVVERQRLVDYYSHEQSHASATNCAAMVRNPLAAQGD